MLNKVGHVFTKWIIPLGEIAAVVLLLNKFFPIEYEARIAFIFLGISLLLALLINLFLTFKYTSGQAEWHKEKESLSAETEKAKKELKQITLYAETMGKINIAFATIDKIQRDENSKSEDYLNALQDFCTHLSKIFSELTDSTCGVCIKVGFMEDSDSGKSKEYKVFTLCRDTHSKVRDEYSQPKKYSCRDNTDFETIFKNIKTQKGKYYFNNSLPNTLYYNNSSFETYGFPVYGFPPNTSQPEKIKNWPLKYRSTIVAPICPSLGDDRGVEKLLGFLCVDSDQENKFNEKYDPVLLVGCADGMFNAMLQFQNKTKK